MEAEKKVPLILISGMLCDNFVWHRIVDGLSKYALCVTADIETTDSVSSMAERILANAPREFAIAGHSLGGRVAFEVVRQAPHRVRLLGLFGTAYKGRPTGPAGDAEIIARQAMVEDAEANGMETLAQKWVQRMVHPDQLDNRPLLEELIAMAVRQGCNGLKAHVRMGLSRPDASDLLSKINVPTLILSARQDVAMPVGPHQEMHESIAGSVLQIIENSGHMLMLEQPEVVVTAMMKWLKQYTETPPAHQPHLDPSM